MFENLTFSVQAFGIRDAFPNRFCSFFLNVQMVVESPPSIHPIVLEHLGCNFFDGLCNNFVEHGFDLPSFNFLKKN